MQVPISIVDAFASAPFTGNPAAVCMLDAPCPEPLLQNIAMELNLSETAFLIAEGDAYRLRWFTPLAEVDLCGHATLASAHWLWSSGHLDADQPARFQTRSGRLTAIRDGDWIQMDFPDSPVQPGDPPPNLLDALGATPQFVGRTEFDYLVEVGSQEELSALQPDFRGLRTISRGVMVTSLADDPQYDFVSRFFAPAMGIDEDPVTGSAHCALANYWGSRLQRDKLLAYQLSRRGGVVRMVRQGDRVLLGGQALTVMQGTLEVG